jgi:hypothetical protein
MLHRIMPLIAAGLILAAASARAQQSPFPAPLPGQAAPTNSSPFPPVNGAASPFPPVNGAPSAFPTNGAPPMGGGGFGGPPGMGAAPMGGGGPPESCMREFMPLREDAEKKAKLIKAASERHAQPDEACKIIGNFSAAEVKMINFIKANASRCGIPSQISGQLAEGHLKTEKMHTVVCKAAEQRAKGGVPGVPSLAEALGSSGSLPEATPGKKGGTTFDTISGNVLAR